MFCFIPAEKRLLSNTDNSLEISVLIINKEPIDDQHPEVKKLLAARYTLENSMEYIERWDTASKALDQILKTDDEDDMFSSVPTEEDPDNIKEIHRLLLSLILTIIIDAWTCM